MTHERLTQMRSAASDGASSRQLVRIGLLKIPVTVVAVGASAILHGGLIAAAYFMTWSPAPASHPKVDFARGDQAARIQVLLVPWPEQAEQKQTEDELGEDASPPESPPVTVSTSKADLARGPEDTEADDFLHPPVAAPEDQNPLVAQGEIENADVPEVRDVEDVRDIPPAGAAADTTSPKQSVGAIVGNLVRQLAHAMSQLETRPQMHSHQPPVAATVQDTAAPLTEKSVQSKASSPKTAGVETGVETLDLPTPRYPSLSRRQGEEGLVLLQIEVLPDGRVGAITVLRDAGFARLTEAAIAAVRKGQFKPATRDGRPVRATLRIPFRFVLR